MSDENEKISEAPNFDVKPSPPPIEPEPEITITSTSIAAEEGPPFEPTLPTHIVKLEPEEVKKTPAPSLKPKKKKASKPKKKKEIEVFSFTGKSIEDQIEETSKLPVHGKSRWSRIGAGILIGIVMLAGLSYGVHRLPELREYAKDYASKLSISKPTPEEPKVAVPDVPKVEIIRSDETVTIYKVGDKEEIRTGGSVSWRYNNPGLIYYGDYAKAVGAIGTDGRYAIFPSYDIGKLALKHLLFESTRGYKNKTLEDAMKFYAPKNEGFNTDYYLKTIRLDTGIPMTKVLTDFTDDEKDRLLKTLEKIERFTAGKVEVK